MQSATLFRRSAVMGWVFGAVLGSSCSKQTEPAPEHTPIGVAGSAPVTGTTARAGAPAAAGVGGVTSPPAQPVGGQASAAAGATSMSAGTAAAGSPGAGAPAAGSSAAGTAAAGAGGRGTAGEPGTPTGNAGRRCHSSGDWTPQMGDTWISPSGDDSAPGSEASPKKTLAAALAVWSPGKTIWVTPGSYALSAVVRLATKATAAAPLRISGVTGGAKPVFDFSSEGRSSGNGAQRGFELSGSYVHLRYLEIEKAGDNCVYVTGSDNTLEWLTVHECQDTGVQLSNGAANNNVLNVDSYLNADPSGENADGFAPKLSIGQGNYFCGTRSYQNADDGYDCWASGDGSPVKFQYCWAFGHPGPTATANGDGNGFKLGSPAGRAEGGNAAHELIDCHAFHNKGSGFTANGNSSGKITCTRCGAWDNATPYSTGSGGALPRHTDDVMNLGVSADKAMNAPRDASGDLPDIETL